MAAPYAPSARRSTPKRTSCSKSPSAGAFALNHIVGNILLMHGGVQTGEGLCEVTGFRSRPVKDSRILGAACAGAPPVRGKGFPPRVSWFGHRSNLLPACTSADDRRHGRRSHVRAIHARGNARASPQGSQTPAEVIPQRRRARGSLVPPRSA